MAATKMTQFSRGMQMTRISIKGVCGKNTVTRPDGRIVNQLIRDAWSQSDRIEIDFGNLVIASVSFIDEAIGLLSSDFSKDELTSKLSLVNISAEDKALLNDILHSRYRQKSLRKATQ